MAKNRRSIFFSHTLCYPTTLSNKYTVKITSSYLVLKAYMDVLCRTIFNRSHKLLLPLVLDGIRTKIDVERIYYEELSVPCRLPAVMRTLIFIFLVIIKKVLVCSYSRTLEIRKSD